MFQFTPLLESTDPHQEGLIGRSGHDPRSTRVVHLNTFDMGGGAARAAHRLHSGLLQAGMDSSMFVREARTKDESVVTFKPTNTFLGRAERRWRRQQIQRQLRSWVPLPNDRFEPFRIDRSEYGKEVLSQLPPHDIVNLHWIADFIDYPSFFGGLSPNRPVVWTLHDMNAFTGGCHYDLGCGRYLDQCGECPLLRAPASDDLSRVIWQRKKSLFDRLPPTAIHFATPSSWLAQEVKKSPILRRFPVSVIPYGLNLNEFAPRDASCAREVFGIPHEAKVVLFVADGLPLYRKGFDLLIEALEHIRNRLPNLHLVTVGHNNRNVESLITHTSLGHLSNDRLLSNIYSAADVLVIPSLQDNLPNTVMEAMACGTPVIGFDIGGIPDMIQHRKTGLLVPPHDAAALGVAMLELLRNQERRAVFGENCRQVAVRQFSLEQQADRYKDLYAQLLKTSSAIQA
jgi:glycosyltransferase involved in cell wall biosynthesis